MQKNGRANKQTSKKGFRQILKIIKQSNKQQEKTFGNQKIRIAATFGDISIFQNHNFMDGEYS